MVDFILANGLELLQAVLMILGGFSILAKFTPTQADDKVLDAIFKVVNLLGLSKK